MTDYRQVGVVNVTCIKILWPHHIFEMGEDRHLRSGVQVDIDEY